MVTTSSPDAWHGITMEAERNVPLRKAVPVTDVHPSPITGELDLSLNDFWARPPAWRSAAYARLRAMPAPPFFDSPESPFGTVERGRYALVRHADVAEASRNPAGFSSPAPPTGRNNL